MWFGVPSRTELRSRIGRLGWATTWVHDDDLLVVPRLHLTPEATMALCGGLTFYRFFENTCTDELKGPYWPVYADFLLWRIAEPALDRVILALGEPDVGRVDEAMRRGSALLTPYQ